MSGDAVNVSLIVIRAIHFAATAVTAGVLIFRTAVAEPALLSTGAARAVVMAQIVRAAWIALAMAVASGAAWVLVQAAAISGLPLREAMSADILSTVATETQFGRASEVRFALAIVLAACLACDRFLSARLLALAAGLGLAAALAWTGHAGAGADNWATVHLTADVMHLIAAAAWMGGLIPLTLLLSQASRTKVDPWPSLAWQVTGRFSFLGMASVGTITASGIVNAWMLVGSFRGLFDTEYGRLLMLKVLLFVIMLGYAAMNRLVLTPDLAVPTDDDTRLAAMGRLTHNSKIEIAVGLTIFAIVGVLGTLHPAIHFAN